MDVSTMNISETRLLQRRNVNRDSLIDDEKIWDEKIVESDQEDVADHKEPRLTLMEEIYLLGLKDKEGYTSFWNDSISRGLRGCMLVELGIRGKIELEKIGPKRKTFSTRKVIVKNDSPTGDALLDEALKHIKESDWSENVESWLEYLSGESWNPLKLRFHMRHVKERVAKNLVDKGVLTTDKTNFILFDLTTHPLSDTEAKLIVIKKIQEALLTKWINDPRRMDPRVLSLVLLARASDVLERALDSLNDDDYTLASRRVSELDEMNMEQEAARNSTSEILWAVFSSFSDLTSILPF